MNPDFPQNEREQLEAKLTAFLLGELPPDEVVALCKAMESDAELAALYEKLKLTIGFVRESAAKASVEVEPQAALKLSEAKREKLLAQFKTIAPKEFVRRRSLMDRLMPWAAAAAVAMVFAWIAIPNFFKSRETARKNSIVNNLRLLDGAEQQWALENRSRSNATPTMAELGTYMGRGETKLPSIAGEKYVPGQVSGTPMVEMNVADAKRVFGPQVVAGGVVSNGKVILSLDDALGPVTGITAQQDVLASPPVSTASPVSTGRIILPAENQMAKAETNALAFNSGSFNPRVPLHVQWAAEQQKSEAPDEVGWTRTFTTNDLFDEAATVAKLNAAGSSNDSYNVHTHYWMLGPSGSSDAAGDSIHLNFTNLNALAANFDVANPQLKIYGDVNAGTHVSGVIMGPIVVTNSVALAGGGVAVDPNSDKLIIESDSKTSQEMLDTVRNLDRKSAIVLPSSPGFGGGGAGNVTLESKRGNIPDAEALEKLKLTREQSVQTSQIVQDGKLLFELGKFDDADAKLNEALSRDPKNQAALYYKSLIQQKEQRMAEANASFDPATGMPIATTTPSSRGALETHTFNVDPNQFYAGLENVGAISTNGSTASGLRYVTGLDPTFEIQKAAMDFFRSAGLDTNKGESIFFNDRQGTVTIRGTPEDLAIAQRAIDTLNVPTNNVTVAAKFSAVEEQDKKVAAAQQKVDELRQQLHISDAAANASSPTVLMTADRLKELTSMRVQKEAEYNQEAALAEKLKGMNREELKKALPVAVQDNQLNSLLSELDLAEQNLTKMKMDYALDHPKYQSAKDLVDYLNRKVDEREDGIMMGLDSKVMAAKAFVDTISNDVAAAQRADIEYGSNAAPYFAAREQLETEKHWRQILAMRTGQEAVDKDLPRARQVVIMNPAVANPQGATNLWGKIRQAFTGKVESTARIDVEQEHPDISGLGTAPAGNSYDPYFLLTEFETIQSDAVLSKVVDAMGLQEKWGKKYNGGTPMSKADVEARIKRQLELKPVKNTKFIDISAYSDDPQEAAKLANQVATSYKQFRDDEYERLKNQGIKSLQEQLNEQDKKVQLAQARVDDMAKQLDISSKADRALPKPAVPPPTPQPEILTRENAFSTFSLNVSDVSFKLAAASLEKGQMPEPASIRSEEFINAFDYRDPEAPAGVPIAFASERARYPFAHNRELLRFSLKTAAAGRQAGRPLNIVLLLDNSGSMERADRVRIIQEALRILAGQLNARDTFSIVTFARTAQLRVDGVSGDKAGSATAKVAGLTPEGGTNLGDALDLAYETVLKHYLANGDNRVVLLTDGAANLGDVNPDALKQKVEAHRKQGVALDCFGIGWEDYNDDLLEVLTRNGDGRYGFINTPEDASTTFVSQIAGALHVAASDVKVQVEFNPKRVISYRQIGYAKHQLAKEQFRDNTVDAAEIAAQEAGNALYTIEINPQGEGSVATVHVRYKVPGTSEYREQAWDVPYTGGAVAMEQASPAMRLAATASAFSEWLATSPFADEVSTDALLKYLNGVPQVYGADKRPAKLEWMIRQAKSISGK